MKKTLLPLAFLAGCASSPPPPESPPPSEPPPAGRPVSEAEVAVPAADALFARALEVAGGREALLALRGFTASGRLESSMGLTGRFEALARAPDLMRTTLVLGPGMRFEEGFDGEIAWANDPVSGARIKEGQAAAEVARRADLHGAARWATHYPERETVGPTTFEGEPAWEVSVVTAAGSKEKRYFHRETGRELGFSGEVSSAMGNVPVTITYGDWEEVAGVQIPTRVKNQVAMGAQVMIFETIEPAAPPEAAFTPPEEVRAMLPSSDDDDAGSAPPP